MVEEGKGGVRERRRIGERRRREGREGEEWGGEGRRRREGRRSKRWSTSSNITAQKHISKCCSSRHPSSETTFTIPQPLFI